MLESSVAGHQREPEARDSMIFVLGGTFRMGSDKHYPEEAPVHHVTVGEFWMDRTPVTNHQFKQFAKATGHVTFAELAPDAKDYPGALAHMLYAGSMVFQPAHAVDLRDWSQWWIFRKGADWRHPYGPGSSINHLDSHPVVHVAFADTISILFNFRSWRAVSRYFRGGSESSRSRHEAASCDSNVTA